MNSLHFSEDTLLDFSIAPEEVAERVEIEEHLSECADCRAAIDSYAQFSASLADPAVWEHDDFATAMTRADESHYANFAEYAARLDGERAGAVELVNALETFEADERLKFVETAPELWTVGVVAELCDRAYQSTQSAPADALRLSDVAVALCAKLPVDQYRTTTLDGINGRSWMVRGRVLHFLSRYPEALSALDKADEFFGRGVASAFDSACVAQIRAMVFRDIDRLDDALALARSCAEVFAEFGHQQRFIHARMVEGAVLYKSGNIRKAREMWTELLRPARTENDLPTLAMLFNNIGHASLELGEPQSAGTYLLQAIPIFEELGKKPQALRGRAIIGRLLISSGRIAEGLARLRIVHEEFERLEMVEEAGLVGMDIVEALLRLNQAEEASVICRYLVERFSDAGLTGNAVAALGYLREAISAGKATPILAKHVRTYIAEIPEHRQQLFAPPPPG